MFYKFVGANGDAVLDVFYKAVVQGSIKLSSATAFNDPFEFKFTSVAPSRGVFDKWHRNWMPDLTSEQLASGWDSLTGPQAEWNASLVPRMNLLGGLYVLCLAQRWDNHLMWAHYADMHRGFAIRYKPEILAALEALPDFAMRGDVSYSETVAELRWCAAPPHEIPAPVVFTKSPDWRYEAEHRVVLSGPAGEQAVYRTVDPNLIAGVILGARVSEALIQKALAVRASRPDFTVDLVSSAQGSYALTALRVEDRARTMRGFL
jgi:hypothetical protein